jgi:dolichyl-diphosphooligosaccharide--protein glycosyltransferase
LLNIGFFFQSARKKKGIIQGKPVVVKGKKPKATNTYTNGIK